MRVLALDGALAAFSCAIVDDETVLAQQELPGNVALERGLKAIAQTLERSAIDPRALDRLAVGIGPGSFTGTRIAISYAKSLAQGWSLPLVGISSFDALEEGLANSRAAALLTVVRGRRGVVSARLRTADAQRRASGPIADVIAQLAPPADTPLCIAGDAEDVLAQLGERAEGVRVLERRFHPAALAVARAALRRVPAHSAHAVRADYGERPAVTPPKS